ncbi:glycosyltransferase [Thermogladius sp. 4427co]|uniref:glycosyltransferase n=1 Tax=Thermogladius sp. 4427co TaxID=3450718 RepID=UPI003F7A9318
MRILLIASGGGHTSFAIALAERLIEIEPGIELLFLIPRGDIYSARRIAYKIRSGKAGIVQATKLLQPQERLYRVLTRIIQGLSDSIYPTRGLDAVFCTGSNHSLLPTIISKHLRGLPAFCVEDPFRVYSKGRTVNLLWKTGVPVFLQWLEQKRLYPSRSFYVGLFYEKPIYRPERRGFILVMTGMMGHRLLFKTLARSMLRKYKLVIQAGRIWVDYVKKILPEAIVFDYDYDIDKWIAGADLVITHQGVSAIHSSQAYGKPVVIAYNPDIPLAGGLEDAGFVARRMNLVYTVPDPERPNLLEDAVEEALGRKPVKWPDGAFNASKIILKALKQGVYQAV